MTDKEVAQRLKIVRNRRWERDFFKAWYGVDLLEKDSLLFSQFETWVKHLPKGSEVIGENDVDHWVFELFCQQREWVPLAEAATRFAMSLVDFELFLKSMSTAKIIAPSQVEGDVPGVYSESFLRNLPKLLPSFPRKLFSSHSDYTEAIHKAIAEYLQNLPIKLLHCSASVFLNENPIETALERDIITCEPIGLGHQIWFEFNKPLSLKPDACSITTYVKHEIVLKQYSMGGPGISEQEAVKNRLLKGVN